MKTLLDPLICSNVCLGRILVGAMDEFESIVTLPWQWLRQQGDVAKLQANHLRIVFLAINIRLEHRTMLLNLCPQLTGTGRHLANVVSLALQADQEIIERRNYFHARCCQGILTGTLEIDDGDALVSVLLGLEVHIALYALYEFVHTFRDAIHLLQSLLVDTMPEHHVWANGTINLCGNDALRHESTIHALLVILPFFGQSVDIERREQRHILLLQELHEIVAQSAMRHIHHSIHLDAIRMMPHNKTLELVDTIHHKAFLLKSLLHIGSRTHKACQHDDRSIFLI